MLICGQKATVHPLIKPIKEASYAAVFVRITKELLIFLACLLVPLSVGIMGIERPYDAIPDQDLLWASEALRLLRGVAPSYADHPGALWTLAYIFNIKIVQLLHNGTTLDQSGSITKDGISNIITLARIENAFVAGTCSYLVYKAAQSLNTKDWLSLTAGLLTSTSSALLIGVSEIRHEVASMTLLLLSIVCYQKALTSTSATNKLYSAVAALSPIAASFCKNQALILTPLLAVSIAFIYLQSPSRKTNTHEEPQTLKLITIWTGYASFTWFIVAMPDIDLINLPFWIVINLTLVGIFSTATLNKPEPRYIRKVLLLNGLAQLIIFKLITPNWWRQAITGFPSWMFRYANSAEDPSTNTIKQIKEGSFFYLSNSFYPASISSIVIFASTALSIAVIFYFLIRKGSFSGIYFLNSAGWILSAAVICAMSQRIASRYEIYFFIPYILISVANLSVTGRPQPYRSPPSLTLKSLKCTSLILLLCATFSSARNVSDLHSFVNPGQDRSVLCIGHHMDKSMKNTSASMCPVFPQAVIDKNAYDPWSGPN